MLSKFVWNRCQILTVKIQQHFTLFSWQKSNNASTQMHHNTSNAVLTKLSTWEYGNGDTPFSWQKFGRVSCLVCYGALVSRLCIQHVSTCLYWDKPKPFKASSILMPIKYTGKPMSHRWHGSRQSHRDDCAHNITWICTYVNRLKHIPILQGQELSWLERVTHIATRVNHTKCTITHTHADICIYIHIHHAQC